MRAILGLIVLFSTYTAEAKTSELILRGRVPAVYQAKLSKENSPSIITNIKGPHSPKIYSIKRTPAHYMVSIVPP